jgi:hypothetical protein
MAITRIHDDEKGPRRFAVPGRPLERLAA